MSFPSPFIPSSLLPSFSLSASDKLSELNTHALILAHTYINTSDMCSVPNLVSCLCRQHFKELSTWRLGIFMLHPKLLVLGTLKHHYNPTMHCNKLKFKEQRNKFYIATLESFWWWWSASRLLTCLPVVTFPCCVHKIDADTVKICHQRSANCFFPWLFWQKCNFLFSVFFFLRYFKLLKFQCIAMIVLVFQQHANIEINFILSLMLFMQHMDMWLIPNYIIVRPLSCVSCVPATCFLIW